MKKTLEEHAERFSELAPEYDEEASPEYRACVDLVVSYADPSPEDVVLDLGTGTGAIALALASDADRVVGRDISAGMLDEARRKADERGLDNVAFGEGRFRDPDYDGPADVVVSNFAMHHLSDAEKREAIDVVAALDPRRFVLGDVMLFEAVDPESGVYDPEVDDPARAGVLADALTDAGFVLTAVDRVSAAVGVVAAERR
ncbi:class I SAM-dependent methyltransferase [Haloplanus halophilus]|uniref:class I SAM-dependent methyltransferase n=1 Tax=Haloplanus halophilus TaxID=2949993 RepID=UPI00203E5612|nr:class I SAM-dependent methyltransferase [Haloplanus sp. GDY1]